MNEAKNPMAKPTAILFDMGGVLLDPADEWDETAFRVSFPEGLPVPAPLDWFLGMSGDIMQTFLALKPPRLAMDVRPIIAAWLKRRGVATSSEETDRWFDVLCRWEARPVFDFVPPTLRALHSRGFRMGVVSNTLMPARYIRKEFERAGIAELFEHTVFSAEFGINKPDPAIFLHALETMQVRPEDAWYVGDKPQRDARGAHGVGMTAVLVDSPHADRTDAVPDDVPDLRIPNIAALPDLLERFS